MNSPTPVSSGPVASNIAKGLGWGQFALNVIGQVLAEGIPTNALGWVRVVGSLFVAFGIHAASNTDGAK